MKMHFAPPRGPLFCTTKSGSSCCFTQSSLRLLVITPMELLAPVMALSSPSFTTRQSQGMLRSAKKRTCGPKMRCAETCTRPRKKEVRADFEDFF